MLYLGVTIFSRTIERITSLLRLRRGRVRWETSGSPNRFLRRMNCELKHGRKEIYKPIQNCMIFVKSIKFSFMSSQFTQNSCRYLHMKIHIMKYSPLLRKKRSFTWFIRNDQANSWKRDKRMRRDASACFIFVKRESGYGREPSSYLLVSSCCHRELLTDNYSITHGGMLPIATDIGVLVLLKTI